MNEHAELLQHQIFLCILFGSIIGLILPIVYAFVIKLDVVHHLGFGYIIILAAIISYNYIMLLKLFLAITITFVTFNCTFAVASIIVNTVIKIFRYFDGTYRKVQDVNTPLIV